jgi:hypothetical protein
LGPVEKLGHAERGNPIPGASVERVDEVVIDARGVEPLELRVEKAVHVRVVLDEPGRQLGGEFHPLAVSVRQGAPDERLAFAAMIGPGRVDVIDAAVDGVADLAGRSFFVDPPILLRQAHATESEDGQLVSGLRRLPVKHEFSLGEAIILACGVPGAKP